MVTAVLDKTDSDPISARLRALGFVAGEVVYLQAQGPLGREPLLFRVGSTRFALRLAEAERVEIDLLADAT